MRTSYSKFLTVVGCAFWIFVGCADNSELSFDGKPISYWLDELHTASQARQLRAIDAIRKIGPPAKETARETLTEVIQGTLLSTPLSDTVRIAAKMALERIDPYTARNLPIAYQFDLVHDMEKAIFDSAELISPAAEEFLKNKQEQIAAERAEPVLDSAIVAELRFKIERARRQSWMGDTSAALGTLRYILDEPLTKELTEEITELMTRIENGQESITVKKN